MNRKIVSMGTAFLCAVISVCVTAAPEKGLVAHWPMDEGQGDILHDASGNGHDAKISGAKWVKLHEGYALEFDGIDDLVECGDAEDLNLTEKVCVEAWVYHRGLPRSNTSILQKGRGYSLGTGYGGNFFFAGRCQTPPLLIPDFWHHMVGIFDGETVAFYLDGNLIYHAEPTKKGPLPDSKDDSLVIASPDPQTIFKGLADDVRIYNRPLSRDEVKAHFETGRRIHENALRVYAYPFNNQVVVQIDPVMWDKTGLEDVIEINVVKRARKKPLVKQVIEAFPDDTPFEAELRVDDLPAGDYEVRVWPRHKRGSATGRELIADLHWPQRPAWKDVSSKVKVLNNFVTELVNMRPGRRGEVEFTNPRTGWVFFASDASVKKDERIEVILEGGQETILKHTAGEAPSKEAMRFLDKGVHVLRIKTQGKSRLDRLVVRAIPELGFAYLTHSSYPHTFPYGPYNWQFLADNHLLENLNVIHGGTWEWCAPYAKEWKDEGKKILMNLSLNRSPESLDDVIKDFKIALQYPIADGTTLDEFPGWGHPGYELWTQAVRRIHADESLANKRLYPYCATLYGWDAPVAFTKAIVESDDRIVWERYLSEPPTQLAARRFIFASLGDRMRLWEKHIPGVTSKMLVCPNLFTSPSLTADVDPGVDYLVFMDMQFHHLANDPGFWAVAGSFPWGAAYADEEVFRWLGKLYRHYCIEGKTEMLTSTNSVRKGKLPGGRRHYKLTHLSNGNFAEGLDGWTVLRGDKGTIEARTELGLDRTIVQWSPAIQRDSFCWMKRDQWAPNTIVQQIKDLEPQRLYSLRFYTRDFKDPHTRQALCVSAKITPAEIIPDKSFQHVYISYVKDKGWLNFHRLVFRAKSQTARLEISDWKMEPGRPFFSGKEGHLYIGAAAGQETMITSVQVQPYMEE